MVDSLKLEGTQHLTGLLALLRRTQSALLIGTRDAYQMVTYLPSV